MRSDNRSNTELRPVTFEKNPLKFSQGSVVISTGLTKVLCTATVEEKVPKFLMGTGQAWVTAEYSMLPGSTHSRSKRERGYIGGRGVELAVGHASSSPQAAGLARSSYGSAGARTCSKW